MKIKFIKDTKDRREGRNGVIKKGSEFSCAEYLAKEYIKAKEAVKSSDAVKDIEVIKNIKDVKEFENKQEN